MSLGSTVFLKDSFQLVSGAQVTTTPNDIVSSVGKENLLSSINGRPASMTGGGTTTPTVELVKMDTPFGSEAFKITFPANNTAGYAGSRAVTNALAMFGGKTYSYSTYVYYPDGIKSGVHIYPTGGAGMVTLSADTSKDIGVWSYYGNNKVFLSTSFPTVNNYMTYFASGVFATPKVIYVSAVKFEESEISTPYTTKLNEVNYDTRNTHTYKTNISLSEPLRSVGDVKDRLFLDTDGLWKVERNVGEYIFNGQEVWSQTSISDNSILMSVNVFREAVGNRQQVAGAFTSRNTSMNNYFKIDQNAYNTEVIAQAGSGNIAGMYLRVPLSTFKTRLDFIDWLKALKVQNKPLIVLYKCEPTIETLSAEQQTKLNNIQSFKGSNYVYTVGSIAPNLTATFKSKAWHRNYVTERDTSEVAGALGGLKDFTDGAFTDGIISRAEAKAIAEHLNTLAKEKADVDANYTTVYGNAKLTGTPKTNLLSAKTAWNTAHANLISAINTAIADSKTTVAEKANVDSKFTAYGASFKLLTQMLQEATIASGKTQSDESAQGAVEDIKLGVVNLVVRTGELVGYLAGGGTVVPTALTSRVMLKRIKVTPGEVLTFTKTTVIGDAYWRVDLHNSAGAYVTRFTDLSNSFQYTVPADIYEIRVSYPADAKVQIERGNKATEWKESPEDSDEKLNKKTGIPVRYIRDWLNDSTAKNGNHWVALQAKTLEGIDRASGILPTSDLALTNPATLTNGITATSSYVTGVNTGIQYIQVDLGKTYYDISDIRVWHYYADGRTYNDTKTEISVDGTNWEPLYDSLTQGTYPETAEGNIMPTTVVDRMRIITSRVALAEQVITPEAITGTVMSQETFVEWKENVDTKANGEDVDNLMLEMGNVQDTLNGTDTTEGIITKMSTVEQKADSWSADITELKEVTGAQGVVTEKVTAYMEFNMTGLEIGKSGSDMKVNISNSQIDFMDKGVSVAYINGQRMFITHVEITESLVIGNHKIEKLEGNSDVTIVSWVGQRG